MLLGCYTCTLFFVYICRKPNLNTFELSITAPGPKVKEVRMTKSGRIDIVFDQRMSHGEEGLKECGEIFDDDSLQTIGKSLKSRHPLPFRPFLSSLLFHLDIPYTL